MHLADDPLDAFGHDVVRDRAEGVRQHDVERQVERVEQRDVRERRIGLHREERAVFDLTGHGVGQGDDVAVEGRAAIAQVCERGRALCPKAMGEKLPAFSVLR